MIGIIWITTRVARDRVDMRDTTVEDIMGRFDGKKALITGGARGQGRSHALRLAREGADVAILDIAAQVDSVVYPTSTPEDLAATERELKELGVQVLAIQCDVRDQAAVEAAVARVEEEFGGIDIVLANAGVMASYGEKKHDMAAWDDSVAIMLNGVYYTLRAVTPGLIERDRGGAIVITGSTSSYIGVAYKEEMLNPGQMGYGAAKSGVLSLMRNFAMVLGQHGVRVNTVIPAGVTTKMIKNEFFEKDLSDDAPGGWMANVMGHGPVEPEEITNAVTWLCSDESRFVTGQSLAVDMGTMLL
ncbi:SDR family oxidoreductase [Gordonia sp. HY002]|uniref:SDR family oxidoreductase n=1 Tax=Gordonia zhenghanii TaxID=2911516 RepID=UPI001EF0144B|nr:SDR family oxidoreductase [Gordonia zhenghanii]MCF8570224.1 SDR family oxidoreductase [Gordonia zhenghanii]MCF8605358.1 SDR family oxidoreductase [Gordonia zhenghanii]MCF8607075.1 SDR family oxidoreductase [Gordonia zhenghanii]